jgi:hypothetical protein
MTNNIKFTKNGDHLLVQLKGSIDEEVNFAPDLLKGANFFVFDFADVKSINSCGIREWIRWLLPHTNAKVVYRNCPKIIVDQINMVDGFLPATATVESFYVPYYSEDTGEEKHVLFTYGKDYSDQGVNLPTNVVDSKNQPMEIDVIESKYFRFLQKKVKAA